MIHALVVKLDFDLDVFVSATLVRWEERAIGNDAHYARDVGSRAARGARARIECAAPCARIVDIAHEAWCA